MLFPEPFPDDILEEIREYPGNDKCCDCPSLDTDWASVSHGTLICLDCAGKHRSLGVHVSFVRSITMDTWSRPQVEMMRQGGNAQIRRFFKKLEIDQSPIQLLYCTKAADHYREKLKERVDAIMSGQMKSEKRIVKKKPFATSSGSFDAHDGSPNHSMKPDQVYQVAFQEGPMGMTLTKNSREQASVSRLLPDGQALKAGVATGDFVVGVAGKTMENYDEIMHMIPLMPRPLTISFARIQHKKSSPKKTSSSPQSSPSSSLPPPPSSSSASSTHFSPRQSPRQSPRSSKKALPSFPESASESVEESPDPQPELSNGNLDTSNIEEEDNEDTDEQTEQELNQSIELPPEDESNSKEEPEDPFQPGSVVKVFQVEEGKWKTAVIHRIHKDGSFKVMYRNGEKESYVLSHRIALPAKFVAAVISNDDHNPQQQQSALSSYATVSTSGDGDDDEEEDDDEDDEEDVKEVVEFKVEATEDLESWIEEDFAEELKKLPSAKCEDSYFMTKITQSVSTLSAEDEGVIDCGSESLYEYYVTFPHAPLGLTLSANGTKAPEVIRVKADGNAERAGVQVGDLLYQIDKYPVYQYEEAMHILPTCIYPLTLRFKRGYRSLMNESGDALMRGSKMLANTFIENMGLQKASILDMPTPVRLSNHQPAYFPHSQSTSALENMKGSSSSTTQQPQSRYLSSTPSEGELDVIFEEGDIGFRLEEKVIPNSSYPVSIVSHIVEDGKAKAKGLHVGCVVLGINKERFLSHAHTVATLKHAKRPILVRFKVMPSKR